MMLIVSSIINNYSILFVTIIATIIAAMNAAMNATMNTNQTVKSTLRVSPPTRLEQLLKNHDQFVNDDSYVYKLIKQDMPYKYYLVTMRKLDESQTNEKRSVTDHKYAKFRANVLEVVSIINIFDFLDTPHQITNTLVIGGKCVDLKYIVNEKVVPSGFNKNINIVCTQGVHYFKTIEAAYYYGRESCSNLENGVHIGWDDDGCINRTQTRNENGNLVVKLWERQLIDDDEEKQQYVDKVFSTSIMRNVFDQKGYQCEEHCVYYDDGKMKSRSYYNKNGLRSGLMEKWHKNGSKELIARYVDGNMVGHFQLFNPDGDVIEEFVVDEFMANYELKIDAQTKARKSVMNANNSSVNVDETEDRQSDQTNDLIAKPQMKGHAEYHNTQIELVECNMGTIECNIKLIECEISVPSGDFV